MEFEVQSPEEFAGGVLADMNSQGATIREVESEGETSEEMEVEDAEVTARQTRTITIDSEYEGTLYFNLAAGHVASLTIVGESNFSITEGVIIDIPEHGEITQSQTMFFEGELEGEVTFE